MARGMAGWIYATISHGFTPPNNGGRRGSAYVAAVTTSDARQPNGDPMLSRPSIIVRGITAATFA
jgi:hypothetical protein